MARAPWAPAALYETAALWVERCLRDGRSLLSPEENAWTSATADVVASVALGSDASDIQAVLVNGLADATDDSILLAAELRLINLLPVYDTSGDTKRTHIEALLALATSRPQFTSDITSALDGGVAAYGSGTPQLGRYFRYLAIFAQTWTALGRDERENLLDDPWAFRGLVLSIGTSRLMQQDALLHLVYPDTFEYALAPADKRALRSKFAVIPGIQAAVDDDHALAELRTEIEAAIGPLNLYADWFKRIWKEAEPQQWTQTVHWAARLAEWAGLDAAERQYKLQIAERLVAVDAVLDATPTPPSTDATPDAVLDTPVPNNRDLPAPTGADSWTVPPGCPTTTMCGVTVPDLYAFLGSVGGLGASLPYTTLLPALGLENSSTNRARVADLLYRLEGMQPALQLPPTPAAALAARQGEGGQGLRWDRLAYRMGLATPTAAEALVDTALAAQGAAYAARETHTGRGRLWAHHTVGPVLAPDADAVRSAGRAGDTDWLNRLQHAFGPPNNLTHWTWENGPFLRWCEAEPDAARAWLTMLWDSGTLTREQLSTVLAALPTDAARTPAARLSIVSFLLLGLDATVWPFYRYKVVRKLSRLTEPDGPPPATLEDRTYSANEIAALMDLDPKRVRDFLRDAFPRSEADAGTDWELSRDLAETVLEELSSPTDDPVERYFAFIRLLDELRIRLLASGVRLRDRLDAQGIAWWLVEGPALEEWDENERAAFLAFREPTEIVVPLPKKAWLVRAPKIEDKKLIEEFLAGGFISIGWDELGDIQQGTDALAIFDEIKKTYPDQALGWWRTSTGNVNSFINRIDIGHLVVSVDQDKIYVGRVTQPYSFDPSRAPGTGRQWGVEWLNADAPASRKVIKVEHPGLYARLRTLLTVTELTEGITAVASLVGLAKPPVAPPAELALPDATDELADGLHVSPEWLQNEIIDLLAEKKQVVFYGPPGTGKTLVAQRIAEHLTDDPEAFELVQFHPSYSYEDFFEGYRPIQTDTGFGIAYTLTHGPLRRLAERATANPGQPHVLVVDEINRGNVPKIFGELLFLLEYRDEQIPLMYSSEREGRFGLPKNLLIIATMNTADRSIALVDAALRRRFYFVPFMPREEPVRDVLGKWLKRHKHNSEADDLLRLLNDRIGNDDIAIGPSYFITTGGPPNLERIWKHSIMPLLEEHYFGTGQDVATLFGLEALRNQLKPAAAAESETSEESEPSQD